MTPSRSGLALVLSTLSFAVVACGSSSSGNGGPQAAGDSGAPATEAGDQEMEASAGGNDATIPMPDAGGGDAGSSSAPPSDLDTKTFMRLLSDQQLTELCDWRAAELGGYGKTVECGGGITLMGSDQAECVASYSYDDNCVMTVAQFEACTMEEAPTMGCDTSGSDCMMMRLCKARTDAGM